MEIEVVIPPETWEEVDTSLGPEELGKRARAALQECVDKLQAEVVAGTPHLTGTTASRIYTEIQGSGVNLTGIVASPDAYFLNLEYGRRVGAKIPPERPLEVWAANKGISGRGTIYLIRRAISRRGIPALHIMERAYERTQGSFLDIFRKHFNNPIQPE